MVLEHPPGHVEEEAYLRPAEPLDFNLLLLSSAEICSLEEEIATAESQYLPLPVRDGRFAKQVWVDEGGDEVSDSITLLHSPLARQ